MGGANELLGSLPEERTGQRERPQTKIEAHVHDDYDVPQPASFVSTFVFSSPFTSGHAIIFSANPSGIPGGASCSF